MIDDEDEGLRARARLRRGIELVLDLSIDPGERVALVGPNGAGKSTAVELLAGALPIDEGLVSLAGRVLDDGTTMVPCHERSVAVLFQDLRLFEHLDARDNVAFGLRAAGQRRRDARLGATEWLERFGLADRSRDRPSQLSGGEAQRVALARALATTPALVLLDEPTAALDVSTRAEIRRAVRSHLDECRVPQLVVTHDPVEAAVLGADRVVVLEGGRTVQSGTIDQLHRAPRSRYVADLFGGNLLAGTKHDLVVELSDGGRLVVATALNDGPVVVSIAPQAITLHHERPDTSARNIWSTIVERVDDDGVRARVHLGAPLRLVAEVTSLTTAEFAIGPGTSLWAACKATEIEVHPT